MEKILANLLWLGVEDTTGLWDARAEVVSQTARQEDEDDFVQAAALLYGLVEAGWITLVVSEHAVGDDECREVPLDEVQGLLASGDSWSVPVSRRSRVVKYYTTDQGIDEYHRISEPGAGSM